jgi:hypothetical protein
MGMVEFVFKVKEKFVLNELSKAFHNRALERIRKKILQEAGVESKLPSSLTGAISDIQNMARAEREFIKNHGEETVKRLCRQALEEEWEEFCQKLKKLVFKKCLQ